MSAINSDFVTEFFTTLLGYAPELEVETTDDAIIIQVDIDQQDSGLLIGHRGEVLSAIQLIFALIQQQSGERLPVRLNINDYRQQRQVALENLAHNAASKVVSRGQAVSLTGLSSYERRLIHTTLSEHPDVVTYSEGEEPHRNLVVDLRPLS